MMPDFSIELPFFAYIRQEQAGDSETPCEGAAMWQMCREFGRTM